MKKKIDIKTININNESDIPIKGSLGLLAYGARGLFAWRKKRVESGVDFMQGNLVIEYDNIPGNQQKEQ